MEIKFNTEFSRWEVYGPNAVTRAGEKQPSFVSASYEKCEAYITRVEGKK